MADFIKIGKTTFKVDSIKQLSYVDFVAKFQGRVDFDLKKAYEKITGEKIGKEKTTTKKSTKKSKSK